MMKTKMMIIARDKTDSQLGYDCLNLNSWNHVSPLSLLSPFQSFCTFLPCLSRAMTRARKNAVREFKGLLCVLLLMHLKAFRPAFAQNNNLTNNITHMP